MTETRVGAPHFPGGTFFWLVLKLPMCERGEEAIIELACGGDGVASGKERQGDPG